MSKRDSALRRGAVLGVALGLIFVLAILLIGRSITPLVVYFYASGVLLIATTIFLVASRKSGTSGGTTSPTPKEEVNSNVDLVFGVLGGLGIAGLGVFFLGALAGTYVFS